MTTGDQCDVFQRLKANIEQDAGERIESDIIGGEQPKTWYCPHGLIAEIDTNKARVFHNVDPKLVGLQFETTSIADGA